MKCDVEIFIAGGEEIILHMLWPRLMFLRHGIGLLDLLARHRIRAVAAVEVGKLAGELPEIRKQSFLLDRRRATVLALDLLNVEIGFCPGQIGNESVVTPADVADRDRAGN